MVTRWTLNIGARAPRATHNTIALLPFPQSAKKPEPEDHQADGQTVIIPAFNEQDRIAETLDLYSRYFAGRGWEILVEMDGCTDHTAEIVDQISEARGNVRALHFHERKGKGGGILEAVREARGSITAFADADGCVSPAIVEQLAGVVQENGVVGAIGSRYIKGAVLPRKQGLARRIASAGFRVLVRTMFSLPYYDTQCGAKAFRRDALLPILQQMKLLDYAFDVELLWRLDMAGYRVVEVPVEWNHEDGSKVRLREVIPSMFSDLIWLRLHGLSSLEPRRPTGAPGPLRPRRR